MPGSGVPTLEAWTAIVTIGVLFAFVAWLCRPRAKAHRNPKQHFRQLIGTATAEEAEVLAARLRKHGLVALANLAWTPDRDGLDVAQHPFVAVHAADLKRAQQLLPQLDDWIDDDLEGGFDDEDESEEELEDDEPEELFDADEREREGATEDAARWPELIRERARRLRSRRWSRYLPWLLLVWPLVIVAMCTLQ